MGLGFYGGFGLRAESSMEDLGLRGLRRVWGFGDSGFWFFVFISIIVLSSSGKLKKAM